MAQKKTGFWSTQDGSVTVDWVMLAAAAIALAVAATATIQAGTTLMGESIVTATSSSNHECPPQSATH